MAPESARKNASAGRRHAAADDDSVATTVDSSGSGSQPLSLTSEELKDCPDLVAVDGRLYDLAGFAKVHPGGAVIEAAGAYDATGLYYSMHAGRDPTKSELLQRFHVGKHVRHADTDCAYVYDSPFAKDLIKTVRAEMGATSWYAPAGFWLRTLAICSLTLFFEYYWITTGGLLWACLVAAAHAQIGLAVQHDASHGALSPNPTVNALFSYGADWIGNNRWIWLQQHVLWHHPYTNHHDYDPDASSAEPLLVFSDYTKLKKQGQKLALKPLVQFQDFITHAVLCFYGPSLVYNFLAVLTMKHNDHIPDATASGPFMAKQKPLALFFRVFYFARVVLAPWYVGGASLLVSLFFVSALTGVFLTFLFVVSHNFEGSDRDPLRLVATATAIAASATPSKVHTRRSAASAATADTAATPPPSICWYQAQVETSCTYGGTFAMLTTGGLNLQIEHHLFPRLSSWYYPKIHSAVRQCCERHGVVYKYYPSLWSNTVSMLRYMREVGVMTVLAHAE